MGSRAWTRSGTPSSSRTGGSRSCPRRNERGRAGDHRPHDGPTVARGHRRPHAMRRIIILMLLLGGMQLIVPLGSGGEASGALLTFGFLILAAYTIGEIATSIGL